MRNIILTALTILAVYSCSLGEFDIDKITPSDFTGIAGKITDSKGNPIEHIKVTIETEGIQTVSAYTSSEGIFIISIDDKNLKISQIQVLIEDVDGEDFGGYYETVKDTVQIDEYQEDGLRLSLDYRLTLSTASEYNPQS
ncbi:MAG: radical SAM-associated putative lipoprotein [Bacteroidales bacterium]|nr:radical SAM-associated putative lipoprotein [Bacteroidales bacterium]